MRPELVVEVRYDKVQGNRFRHGTKWLRWRDDKEPGRLHVARAAPAARPERGRRRVAARLTGRQGPGKAGRLPNAVVLSGVAERGPEATGSGTARARVSQRGVVDDHGERLRGRLVVESVAVHVTTNLPMGNVVPACGSQSTGTDPSTASEAVGVA